MLVEGPGSKRAFSAAHHEGSNPYLIDDRRLFDYRSVSRECAGPYLKCWQLCANRQRDISKILQVWSL
jgi:hypothetical protein